jgi:hypothetical protein
VAAEVYPKSHEAKTAVPPDCRMLAVKEVEVNCGDRSQTKNINGENHENKNN